MVNTIDVNDTFLEPHTRLGEGPLYDHINDLLIWVDIIGKKIHWVDYSQADNVEQTRKSHKWVTVDDYVSCIELTPTASKYVVAAQYGFGFVDFAGAKGQGEKVEIEYIDTVYKDEDLMRFNDGVVDPRGRFLAGSMWEWRGKPNFDGKLFSLDTEGFVSVVHGDIGTPNGMSFSPDSKVFYFTDSDRRTIYKFDYNVESGQLSNKKEFIVLSESEGTPDGHAIDTDGNLWVAVWGGYCVRKYSPTAELLEVYKIPAERVSCTAFAGKDNTDLIVTCASLYLDDHSYVYPEGGEKDKGGEIFRIKLKNVKGAERYVYKG